MGRRRTLTSQKLANPAGVVLKGVRVDLMPSTHAEFRKQAVKRGKTVAALARDLIEEFVAGERPIVNLRAIAALTQVWEATKAQPFCPFVLKLVDGRSYAVSRPDSIRITASGREQLSLADKNGLHEIDPVTIIAFETMRVTEPESGDGAQPGGETGQG
jgi:hypothetical protein